jgi:hypothetical protein
MVVTVRVIQRDYNEKKASFNPRPYFRLFVTWLMEFNSADSTLDSSNFQVQSYNMSLLFLPVFIDLSTSTPCMESFSHQYLCIFNGTVLMRVTRFWLLLEMLFGPFNLSKYLAGGEFLVQSLKWRLWRTCQWYIHIEIMWLACTFGVLAHVVSFSPNLVIGVCKVGIYCALL